jgi:hypothetical protein
MELFKNLTPNARALAKAQVMERVNAARAKSLVAREALGMGKTAKFELGLAPNERNTAKLAKAAERAAKLGLTKKR